MVSLIRNLRSGEHLGLTFAADLATKLEDHLVALFRGHLWPDDLDRMYGAIEKESDILSADVFDIATEAIMRSIDAAWEDAASIDSESMLKDHIKAFERLAPRAGIPPDRLKKAISEIQGRISAIDADVEEASSPDFSGSVPRERDKFDDTALQNLHDT